MKSAAWAVLSTMNRREFLRISLLTAGLTFVPLVAEVFAERYLVQVNRYRIPVPNLPPQFNGFTIVHLTDLHYGLVSESFVRNVVNKANSLKGDVIVCTGDFVHHRNSHREINGVWPILSELQAPLGVYSVLGNHDHGPVQIVHFIGSNGLDRICDMKPLIQAGRQTIMDRRAVICGRPPEF
jgi:predicted MPP superfamily phosphohydrolase